MERRVGLRGRTDFSVITQVGLWQQSVRAVEVSATGIVLHQKRPSGAEYQPLYVRLTICLPERRRPIPAIARPVHSYGCHQAYRFVQISDVDRLSLAEHLDVVHRRGTPLN